MGIDLAVGTVTAMAVGALSIGIKLLMDVLRTSNKRFDEEIHRLEVRHADERAEWAIERAAAAAERSELRARIQDLERHAVFGDGA